MILKFLKIICGFVFIIIIASMIVFIIEAFNEPTKICESHGYDFSSISLGVEPGYLECCKYNYLNHYRNVKCNIIEYKYADGNLTIDQRFG